MGNGLAGAGLTGLAEMGVGAVQFKLFDVNEPLSRLTRGLL
ncbi:hypothetical protein AAGU50_19955 [Aeromonas dhakensis]|nr:hypothetical protein [Aeromonas dhakensis]